MKFRLWIEQQGNNITVYRGEAIDPTADPQDPQKGKFSTERLKKLESSIGKSYPSNFDKGWGTYVSPIKKVAMQYSSGPLIAKFGVSKESAIAIVSEIELPISALSIDEAVFEQSFAYINPFVKNLNINSVKQRQQMFLKTFGPGAQKYLDEKAFVNPSSVMNVQQMMQKRQAVQQTLVNKGHSEEQPDEKPYGDIGTTMKPLIEKMRTDPEIVKYYLQHNPGNFPEFNFRIDYENLGQTKLVKVWKLDKQTGQWA